MEPRHAKSVVHKITNSPGHVASETWHRIPLHLYEPIKQELQKMLDRGIIRESRSQRQSPLVVIPKKDESLCLCIDFRTVNAVVKCDDFPMPCLGEMIGQNRQVKFITTLDMMKEYWKISMAAEDHEKMVFGIPWGLFEFCHMPFRLRVVAPTFQRLTDCLLTPY